MKILYMAVIILFGGVLFFATLELPSRGEKEDVVEEEKELSTVESPSEFYIKNSYEKTGNKNLVNSILTDFRSIDTLGEEIVIFTAGMICYLLLFRRDKNEL